MQLSEKIYFYPWTGRANNCNSYLLKGEQVILFDPGHIKNEFDENCIEALRAGLKSDGFSFEDIDLILLTHAHPDHSEAAGLVREEAGAKLGMHEEDFFILEGITLAFEERSGLKLPAYQPDFYFKEGLIEEAAGLALSEKVEVIFTPGHSPGSVCFYLEEEKALISGDTIFQNSIGRTDFPGGDMEKMRASVDKLAALENVELLLPGHMGYVNGKEAVARNFAQIKRYFF